MYSVKINQGQIDRIKAAVEGIKGNINKEMAAAVNETARITTSHVAKQVQTKLSVSQKVIKKHLKIGIKATPDNPSTEITFKKSHRIKLSDFSPSKSRKGISVKVNPYDGRSVIQDVFMIPKFGNRVWKRVGEKVIPTKGRYAERMVNGKLKKATLRQRIMQPKGASPLRVYTHHYRLKPLLRFIEERLVKDIEKRINYLIHKAAGTLRGKQKA